MKEYAVDADGAKTFPLEIDTTGSNWITIGGTEFYPVKHGDDNQICVYLTTGDGKKYTVKTANTEFEARYHRFTSMVSDYEEEFWLKYVKAPEADITVYTYNGKEQTYNIPESCAYTITGNKQTNQGTYTETLTRKDTHFRWTGVYDETGDLTYTFIINKAPALTFDNIEKSFVYTATGQQSVDMRELPEDISSYDYTITASIESDTDGILDSGAESTKYEDGKIYFTLNSNAAEKIGKTAAVLVTVSSLNYEDITYKVNVTLTDKNEQTAPTLNDFTLDFTVDSNNKYAATINTNLTDVEYSFDGVIWSDVNTLTNIAHDTQVKAYIRYAETDTQYESDPVSKSATTAHGNLTLHDAVPKKCL